MSELTGEIRLFIERQIDEALKEPNTLTNAISTLTKMGIQPNLETTLSLITGIILGGAYSMWLVKRSVDKKSAEPSDKEQNAFSIEVRELLGRRAMELRQHFIQSEYM